MECTMPTAKFTPINNEKTKEYVLECLSEANRGLSFLHTEHSELTQKIKNKIFKIEKDIELLYHGG